MQQTAPLGSTWSNLGSSKIDLDNLMSPKNAKNAGPTLSMNELKSQSPIKQMPLSSSATTIKSPSTMGVGGSGGPTIMPQMNLFGTNNTMPAPNMMNIQMQQTKPFQNIPMQQHPGAQHHPMQQAAFGSFMQPTSNNTFLNNTNQFNAFQ